MKTLDELLECLRVRFDDGTDPHLWGVYMDMIKSAAAREREAVTDCNHIGNAAEMRDALIAVSKAFDDSLICTDSQMSMEECDRLDDVYHKVKAALSAPPRQCDVGTAKEQFVRWMAFCGKYDDDCTGCPCDKAACVSYTDCFARWAQTSYEAEEGGAS